MALNIKLVLVACVLTLTFQAPAQNRISLPSESAASCSAMMKDAKVRASRLPEGVEKAAAEMEIADSQSQLARGAESECKVHIKNAMMEIKAKGTN
jgi:hypothetical protein